MLDCKSTPTPLLEGFVTQSKKITPGVDQTNYCQALGKLLYLTNTRPDLSHSVGLVTRFMFVPQQQHMEVVHHILRYIKGTLNYGIFYNINRSVS